MIATLAIAAREWASYYRTSIGWVVTALFLLLAGVTVSVATFLPGAPATLRSFFAISHLILIVVAPAISMRLISDEIRTGTLEPLMASPVSDWQTIFAKYFGAVGFLFTMLAPSLVYVIVLEAVSDPDYGPILAGYLGIMLTGMLYIAIGLLFSSFTDSQVVALLATLFFLLILEFAANQLALQLPEPWTSLLFSLSVRLRLADFAKGVIDTSHLVFFVVASFWFLVLSVVSLEFRRWR